MPSTPKINFNFINNNVEESSPLNGISTVLARTTKGPVLDPSTLIKSVTQFQRTFGEEIVPDGSVSNIQKALEGGSIFRIIRVVGKGATLGTVNEGKAVITIKLGDETKGLKLTTRGAGEPIGTGSTYTVKFVKQQNTVYYEVIDANGSTLETGPVFTYKTKDASNNTSIDYLALAQWISINPYFKVTLADGGNLESFLTTLAKADGTPTAIEVTLVAESTGTIGTTETAEPTSEEYIDALEYIRDYVDSYNIILSHLEQHLKSASEAIKVYTRLKIMLDELNEFRGFIEVPWFNADGSVRTKAQVLAAADQIINTIGNSKWISYFTAGLKYNNAFGIPQNSDVIGTVVGLADASATAYGYNYSFAGVRRGVVPNAQGPVLPNYGSPGRVEDLEEFAQHYLNLFVIKDTPAFGKRTLLWHNFTSQVKQDSFRFLGNTGLVLNIKKTLRPILESYIEEPNYWGTWKAIYLQVKPLIDEWVTKEAMTDPSWEGDQDASSWADLQINTEAAARSGHYKVRFSFKDIVALQDITIDVVIEKASKSVSIDINE
ncbi:MAG: hypothetical protein NC131_06265 [Roseburia sp.]|nr:hypothetical protein [Roseburia sp.]